jgi:hypothetical protein
MSWLHLCSVAEQKRLYKPPEIDELLSSAATFDEVQEYAVILARKRHLSLDVLLCHGCLAHHRG